MSDCMERFISPALCRLISEFDRADGREAWSKRCKEAAAWNTAHTELHPQLCLAMKDLRDVCLPTMKAGSRTVEARRAAFARWLSDEIKRLGG